LEANTDNTPGLRWIFEALAGGDLSGIEPKWFCDESSETYSKDLEKVTRELAQVTHTLRTKTHAIVGHNLFTDLGFIYNTFMGPLPRSVRQFQDDIHEQFPIVIDTKFLATHGADPMNPRAGLKDLLTPFKKSHVPLIVLEEKHTAYGAALGKDHEAGFDSLSPNPLV
jgi:poly(A)-specific ribonuclease